MAIMRKRTLYALTIAATFALLAGCPGPGDDPVSSDGITVFVSIPPQQAIVQRIGGERVDAQVLIGPGRQPHAFEPSPRQMVALAKARLYLTIGVPFEPPLVERIQSQTQQLGVVDMAAGVTRRQFAAADAHEHDSEHGHEHDAHDHAHHGHDHSGHDHSGHDHHDHAHEGDDPHVWLSPVALKTLATNTAAALAAIAPEHTNEFNERRDALLAELDQLHDEIGQRLAPYRDQTFYVYHPAFGYFGDAYGLKQRAVEIAGKSPTPKQLRSLVEQARDDGATVIFVQKQFDRASAEALAEAVGCRVVAIDPLAGDVIDNLRQMAEAFDEALKP